MTQELSMDLSEVLEARAVELLQRHLGLAKEWFPHELVPWRESAGPRDGSRGPDLSPVAVSSVWVGLLTEDNLPHYFHAVASSFGFDSALGEWARRWAAEEQRHSTVIRDWMGRTSALDLVALERARMRLLTAGFAPGLRGQTPLDGLVYLALQELATRVSHRNTAGLLDGTGSAVFRQIAADENLHYLFYRDLVTTAIAASPSQVVAAIDRQVSNFVMPGTGMDEFAVHAARIASAGVYDFQVHFEQVIAPVVLKHWRLEFIEPLDRAATQARTHVLSVIARLRRISDRMSARRPD